MAVQTAVFIRAAIYCRVSRAAEARGVVRQEDDGRRIADEKGWTVGGVYVDNNLSASEFSRKARSDYLRLLADIEAGQYDAVIMWMEDRGHRQVIEAGEFVRLCKDHGVHRLVIISDDLEYDLTDPTHVANFFGKVVDAQKEAAKMSKRQRRAMLQRAELGKPQGGSRAFGFERVVKDEYGNIVNRGRAGVAIIEPEAELIREAARRIIAGDSVRSIVTDWTARGIKTASGKVWTRTSLRTMLTGPRLAGLRKHHDRLIPAVWEPILDREVWETVRALLNDPARRTTEVFKLASNAKNLLVGLAYCSRCTTKMVGHPLKGRRTYVCRRGEPYYGCGARTDAKWVDDLIIEALFQAVGGPEFQRQMQAAADGDTDGGGDLVAELAIDQGRLDRLVDKLADELISEDEYRRQRSRIEARMDAARKRLNKLHASRTVAHLPTNLRGIWPDLSFDRKRSVLAAIFERIEIESQGQRDRRTWDPNKINVVFRTP